MIDCGYIKIVYLSINLVTLEYFLIKEYRTVGKTFTNTNG